MRRAVVLTHEEFESPSRIAELLVLEGCSVEIRRLYRGDTVPCDLERDDWLVVMGGSMGVGDMDSPAYPYLRAEADLLRLRIEKDAPTFGICLGAQLLAYAAGARVYPMRAEDGSRAYEVGWGTVRFEGARDRGVLAGLAPEAVMLHWHGDTFDLPAQAVSFASSALCANQGFQLGQRSFGLQFHCESTAADAEDFLRADGDFVIRAHGESGIERIRGETEHVIQSSRDVGDRLIRNIFRAMRGE